MDIWRRCLPLANLTTDRSERPKGETMLDELTEELLDLSTTVRGHGGAMYAVVDDPGCSSGLCSSIILCCTCTSLCW
jgi:hypothetical protein